MAVFNEDIIEIEGGYSNDPDDPGGETKYGISKSSYPNLDIKNLTIEQAIEIYKTNYWNPLSLNSIQHQTTANLIFRFAVNAGPVVAVKMLQECLNTFVLGITNLSVDGIMGSRTIKAINNVAYPLRLEDCFRIAECRYYLSIVDKNISQEKYFKGWIKRALM